MKSIENKILISLRKCGRGGAFTPARFAHYGTASAVQKAIERFYNIHPQNGDKLPFDRLIARLHELEQRF